MQVKRFVRTGLVMAVLIVGLIGCGDGDDDSKSVGSRSSSPDVVASDGPPPRFDPDTLEAPVNSEVSFTLENEGDVVHNFTVDGLPDVDVDVQPGETKTITFRVPPPAKGLDFYSFHDKNYQGEGMQGRINVT